MTLILNIESTTNRGSISLTKDGKLIESLTADADSNFSAAITIYIQTLLSKHGANFYDLSAIAFSMGPGSYTSLRIGMSVAKGICFGTGIPLIGIPTLDLLTEASIHQKYEKNSLYIGMIDARRMDIYCSIYNSEKETILPESFVTLNDEWFHQWQGRTCILCGDGSKKVKALTLPNCILLYQEIEQSAELMTNPSYQYFLQKQFLDLAHSTPNYLKPPNITTQKHIIN